MRQLTRLISVLLLAGCAGGVYRDTDVPIASAAAFDPARFVGLWHEVARYPVPFQSGCIETTARYGLLDDGRLSVENTCRDAETGVVRRIRGTAEQVGPGRLSVRLGAIPFAAPYWVLWVTEDYRTAVVGVPSGRAGWVLSRTPDIPPDRWRAALEVLAFNGYRTEALIRERARVTGQP